jgi:hypothetical protein
LTAPEFEAALGSTFQVVDEDSRVMVSLSLVHVVRRPEQPGRRQPFSLYWSGEATTVLRPLIHHLVHPELGDMEIFLGPIATDGPGVTYEAVFG